MPYPKKNMIFKKIQPLIYVLDTSGGMHGEYLALLNEAMAESIRFIRAKAEMHPDIQIAVGILTFATETQWITGDSLVNIEDFSWTDLDAGGLADFGHALKEIDKKFTRKAFFSEMVGYYRPVIIAVSRRMPTDNWQKTLEEMKKNNACFRNSARFAFAVDDEADLECMFKFVSGHEPFQSGGSDEFCKIFRALDEVVADCIFPSTVFARYYDWE